MFDSDLFRYECMANECSWYECMANLCSIASLMIEPTFGRVIEHRALAVVSAVREKNSAIKGCECQADAVV